MLAVVALVATVGAATVACDAGPTDTLAACPADRVEGTLEPLGVPGSIGIMVGPRHLLITWSGGYRSAEVEGALAVVSPAGAVVARAGDRVQIAGVEFQPGDWLACGPPVRAGS